MELSIIEIYRLYQEQEGVKDERAAAMLVLATVMQQGMDKAAQAIDEQNITFKSR